MTSNAPVNLKEYTAQRLINTRFPDRWDVLTPWLRNGETAIIWAPSGVGKTMLSLSIALAIAGGGKVGDWSAPSPRKVLYIDGEMNIQDLRDRLIILADGPVNVPCKETAFANLTVIPRQDQEVNCSFYDITEADHQTELLRKIKADNYEVVIFDNLTTLSDGLPDENDATQFKSVQELFMNIKRAGVVGILVHHSNKSGSAPRGSTALETTFEVILGLRKPAIPVAGKAAFVTEFGKFRGKGDARLERRTWTLDGERWAIKDYEPENAKEGPVYQAIKSLEYVSQQEIAEALGMNKGTVSRQVHKLKATKVMTDAEVKECFDNAREFRAVANIPDDPEVLAKEF